MAVVAGGLLAAPLSAQAAAPVSVATAVAEILADTNALRAAGGLAPLAESTQVDAVAQNWSAQMSANGAMSHNPNYSTQIPAGWTSAGENVATGYSYTAVVEAWHQSAGHYANIMGNYNTIGIGYYDLNGQTYFTQDFGNYSTVPSPVTSATARSNASVSGGLPTGNPFGSFDSATVTGLTTATINGWSIDPDSTASIATHIYVDGAFNTATTASAARSDIAAAYPLYGANHGWSTNLTLSGGTHTICAYGINAGPGNNNTQIGCRTITLPTGNPFGSFDSATVTGLTTATINGWSIDPDSTASIATHIYVDGAFNTATTASAARSDIAAAYPLYGANHGWSTNLTLSGGTHTICAYGINAGPGNNNTQIGCRTITLPTGNPFGSFDSATVTGLTTATINGWSIDPDSTASIATHIYVDGAFNTATTASAARSDIAAAYPLYGANHGWSTNLTLSGGTHTICAYGINAGPGNNNTQIGCRTITLTGTAGSGTAMPTGNQTIGGRSFTPVMSEDFTRNAALGSFTSVYGNAWGGYTNVTDTSGHGLYSPDQVLSVSNSTLDWYLHTVNGQPLVAAPQPTGYTGQAYGAYSVRYRTDAVKGYKTAFLLWPTSGSWNDGEIDWPDGNLASTIYPASKIVGDPNGAFDKPAQRTAPNEGTGWHTATITWTPGLVQFYLDGAMIGQTSNAGGVPTKAMRWVLQVETSLDGSTPAASAAGHVQVDWVVQYKQS